MVLLEVLRNKWAVFVGIAIGLAMLAFILTDMLTSGRSLFSRSQMEVGRINGTSVDYMEYMRRVEDRTSLQQAMGGGQAMDAQMTDYLREQVWQDYIHTLAFEPACEAAGVTVSDEELSSHILGDDPHPMVKQAFTDPNTGAFNREMMLQFLQHLDEGVSPAQRAYWLEMEREIGKDVLMQKYSAVVSKGLWVTSLEAQQRAALEAPVVNASYVVRSYAAVPDSTITVSDEDLRVYYQQHQEEFRQPELRDVAFVSFPVQPTQLDKDRAQEWLEKYRAEFARSSDAGAYATQNGDQPYTGAWQSRAQVPAELAAWAFDTAAVGATSPLMRTSERLYVARLLGRKTMADSAQARHILISYRTHTPDTAQRLADSLLDVIRHGGDFAALAAQYSDDPGSKSRGGALDWFAQGAMVKPFNDACFNNPVGTLITVKSDYGVHVIEVQGHRGESTYVDLAILASNYEAGSETHQAVFNEASSFAALAHTERPGWWRRMFSGEGAFVKEAEAHFDSLVAARGVNKQLASGVRQEAKRLNNLDEAREVVRWAYGAKPGQTSSVFELPDQYVVAFLVRVHASDGGYATLDAVTGDILPKVMEEKKKGVLSAQMAEAARGVSGIQPVGSKLGEPAREAEQVSYAGYSFGREGFEPAAIGATVALKQGQRTAPVAGNMGVFLIQAESVSVRPQDEQELRARQQNELQTRISYSMYDALQRMAKIEDRRARFL